MRILFDYRPALRHRTGVGEYVHETAKALLASAPADEHLTLFSSSWKDRLVPGAGLGTEYVDSHVPVRLLHLLWHRLEWPPVEWIARSRFDLAQAAHPLLIPSRTAARIVTVYDLDFLDAPERTSAEIRRDYPALAGDHARRADHVVVISTHTADAVEARLSVPRSKITICPPGAPAWPKREAEPGERACILFVGTLEPRKNLDLLLDAYASMLEQNPATPPLVLAGAVPPSAERLVRRTKEPPLMGHVEMPGYVSDAEKAALFARALVFVMPSHGEGFGIPVAEAMAVGVPVVVASRGALPETVGNAGRLVPPDDPLALADALTTILGSAALRREMREAGWAQVAQFTWARTASRIRDAWRHAIEHHARRRG